MGLRTLARLSTAVGAATIIALPLAGCSGTGVAKDGPLRLGGSDSEVCVSADLGEEIGIGQPMTLNGPAGATINEVSVHEMTGLEMVGSFVVPVVDNTGTGTFRADNSEPSPGWQSRSEAEGAEVESGVPADLVLLLKRDSSEDGSIATVSVQYTIGSADRYEATGTFLYKVVEGECV